MQTSTRFSMAIHLLMCVETYKDDKKVTSDVIAESIGTNPVIVRKIMGRLKDAGIIESIPGTGGIQLLVRPERLNLKDIYYSVEVDDGQDMFKIHANASPECEVGKNIQGVLGRSFNRVQKVVEDSLEQITLAQLIRENNSKTRKKQDTSYILL